MAACISELIRSQLEKVLSSPGFARNDRLSSFLRFVVEQELSGRGDQLKESIIGAEVFGRRPGYDVRQDSVVRTEAAKLRVRLADYYVAEGAGDPLIIELPKGGYKPVFRPAEVTSEAAAPAPEDTPVRLRMRLWLAGSVLGLVVLGLAAVVWWRARYREGPIPIAVLPLINLSQDSAHDYFADGLTGEIIRNLCIVDGLAVRSQTSSFAFKGKPRNVRDIGKQMAVDYILEGSVLRTGQQLRINVQFIRVRDDFPLWSGKYDRELTDVLVIQDEISRGIVNSLRLRLGRGRRRYEASPEAYDLYLHARALQTQLGLKGLNSSIGPFEQAIAKDPLFAPAYAGLAAAYAARSGQDRFDRAEEMSKMRAAVERAIQLDPLLPEAHDALGAVYARDAQWEQSEKGFRRAIELDPNRSLSRTNFALSLLLPLGRIEEAFTQVRMAERTDALSPQVQDILAYVLISAGRFDEAAAHCRKLPAGYPPTNGGCLARALLGQGNIGEAIRILEDTFVGRLSTASAGELGYAYARAGRREEAEKVAALAPRPFDQALVFAGLGDKDRTLEALDRMTPLGPLRLGRALTFPEFGLIRGDPRVKSLRRKVRLPE